VRGEVLVAVETDRPERVFRKGRELEVGDARGEPDGRRVLLEGVRSIAGGLILKLQGVQDRDALDAYRGTTLLIPATEAEPAGQDEVHYRDLVGLSVISEGNTLGKVTGILQIGPSELLEVRRTGGGEMLVPFVAEIVRDVNLDRREVTLHLPDGFLEI
jgi:16S rRNA processing protein RimM